MRLGQFCVVLAGLAAALLTASIAAGTEPTPGAAPVAAEPAPPEAAVPAKSQSVIPPPPGDPRAAKVYAVFDEYCARCHQTGKLQGAAAARPVANILAIDDLGEDATLVKPGLPDASPLYTILLRHHASVETDLPATSIQAVRDWISDLPEPSFNCGGRPKIAQGELEGAIAAALTATAEEKRRELRFITLSHLADACVSQATLAGYRQAVTKIVNTLSWGPEPIRLEAFGPDDTILKLDLGRLGWVNAHWDKIIQTYPYASLASSRLTDQIRQQTGTSTPAIRADWLAHATTATPLYAQLLGLPGRIANLQRILNVDIEADIASAKARRAGLTQSAVVRGHRLVERHPTRSGSLWLAYDFATGEGRQNLLALPLGPTASASVKVPFKHDAIRTMFTLPNGFIAFSLHDSRGDRIDASPEGIERDDVTWSSTTTQVAGCVACHQSGPVPVVDQIRAAIDADTTAPKEIRDAVSALYAPTAEIEGLIAEDRLRYADAQSKAGINPTLLINGLEPVTALAREYTHGVNLARLAVESGYPIPELTRRLAMVPSELRYAALRVQATVAPRAEADRLLIRLAPDAGRTEANLIVTNPPEQRDELDLLLWSRAPVYDAGQLATFFARSSQNCYLTLISLDRAGQATVLFPNEFEQNNLLVAGRDLMLPAEGASYQLRLRDKGQEMLIGICQTGAKVPDGIQHDFERQRFTMLGDWRAFLGQAATSSRPAPGGEQQRSRQQRAAKGRTPPPADPKTEARPVPDTQVRTAIRYEIR